MWQNQLVVDRKASGAWAKTDALYVFANVNSQLTKTNWKSPGNNNATEVNAPTFTADVGYKGNGTSAYIDTNFDLSVDSVQYTLDSSSYGLYQTNTVTANGPVMSATNLGFTNRSEFTQYTTGLYTMSLNSSEISGLLTAGPGFWQVNRSVSTDIAVYKD